MANDGVAQALVAIEPAGALRGNTVDVLNLAHNLQLVTGAGLVEGTAFHEDRADHVVATGSVCLQFVEGVIGR